ncbi:hypothetical protein NDU88_004388 [Pleurodeles waltl]|uniref:Uncharacterized protein n=1 Tax=Pleurodeles waltl TaxID=8319 RepID=A0AAV7PKU7_PLEWA|nr:hypothetical protein NDU88_004388 [Pleurodeles waltl]
MFPEGRPLAEEVRQARQRGLEDVTAFQPRSQVSPASLQDDPDNLGVDKGSASSIATVELDHFGPLDSEPQLPIVTLRTADYLF